MALVLTGCGGGGAPPTAAPQQGPQQTLPPPTETTRPDHWPKDLVAGPGTGPALYLRQTSDAPAIGYVSPGVPVRIASGPHGDRIKVLVAGSMQVRGWMSMERLAARVQKRGRIGGTSAYVGPNDVVRVVGAADREGLLRVEARPVLGPQTPGATLGPFVGVYPANRLGARELAPGEAEGPTPGEPHALPAGAEVPVYDKPGGEVVATLPAADPPLKVVVLREQGGWKGIRAGVGPYLVGFVDAELTPAEGAPSGSGGGLVGEADRTGPIPSRLQTEGNRPLWRLQKGTAIRFNGEPLAKLKQDGFAREMSRYDNGEVDVFAAVDDRVAVRGMVDQQALLPYEQDDAPGAEPSREEGSASAPSAPQAPSGDGAQGDDPGAGAQDASDPAPPPAGSGDVPQPPPAGADDGNGEGEIPPAPPE